MATENIHRMAAILFTDMVGFSHQMQLDEALTMRLLDEHNAIIEARIDTYRGRVIKTVGDAFMAEFPSSLLAVKCALDIQSALDKRNEQVVNDNERIEVRMGVHVGDVHERDGDLFGVTVNVASRLEPLAAPGTLCVSVDVLKQVLNQVHADAEDLGAPDLKGIKTRFPVFRLRPSQDRLKRPRKRAKRIDRGRAIAMLLLVLFAGLLWQQKSRLKAAEPAAQITDKILEVASTNHWGDLKTYNNSASIGMTALYNAMEHIIPFGKKHGPDQLLERFEHDVDYKIWRMKLRTGVFFHPHPCLKDGQTREATGADLLYSLRANSFSEVPSDYAQSMVLGEDDVVTVLLHDSDISFPRRLWTIPLFPRELDGCDEPSDFKQPSATGPWRFTGPLNGTDLTLSRWSKWWNKKSLKGQLPGKMRFHQVPNAAEAIQGVSDGRFDLFQPAGITEPKSIVAQAETVENVTTAHDQLPCTTLEYRLPISGDFRDLLVANTDLAWALTHAIDREKIIPLQNTNAIPWGRVLLPDQFGYDPGIRHRVFDLDLARKFYQKAQTGPLPTQLKIGVIHTKTEAIKILVEDLRSVGFPAEMVLLGKESFWPAYYDGTVDMVMSIGGNFCQGDERPPPLEISRIINREERRKAWGEWERKILKEGNSLGLPQTFLGRFPAGTPSNFIFHGPRVKEIANPKTQQLYLQHRNHFAFVEILPDQSG